MGADGNRRRNAAKQKSFKKAMTLRAQKNTVRVPCVGFADENMLRVALLDDRDYFQTGFTQCLLGKCLNITDPIHLCVGLNSILVKWFGNGDEFNLRSFLPTT